MSHSEVTSKRVYTGEKSGHGTLSNLSKLLIALLLVGCNPDQGLKNQARLAYERIENAAPRNVIFILTDDHRFDFMGFTGKVSWLKTPQLDRMAKEGAYFRNAFVTTALCSPSRASILTGLFSHTHTVVDNQAPAPKELIFFPEYLQATGYLTSSLVNGTWVAIAMSHVLDLIIGKASKGKANITIRR